MKKMMSALTMSAAIAGLAGGCYMMMKKKNKNMLDIIIEEIDTVKK